MLPSFVTIDEAYRLVVALLLVWPVPAHPPPPVVASLEHVGRGHRVQRPVAALAAAHVVVHAGPAPRDLDETVVQAQVVSDGVLPALSVAPVIRELVRNIVVYLAKRHPLVGRGRDGHGDERYVRVGRFLVATGGRNVRSGHRGRGRRVLFGGLVEQADGRHLQRTYYHHYHYYYYSYTSCCNNNYYIYILFRYILYQICMLFL